MTLVDSLNLHFGGLDFMNYLSAKRRLAFCEVEQQM